MRLMRTVLRPSNIDLSRQFQRFHSISNSSARQHGVAIEKPNFAHGSNIQLCGRSYAASASSNPLEARQGRRRVSKDERRSMVENYVKKYREMNAGKFPTVSDAQKDVGGSYYLVRQILQELIYNSKRSTMDTKDALLEKSAKKEKEVSTNSREVSQTKELREPISQTLKVDIELTSSKNIELKQGSQPSISVEDDKSKHVGHVHCQIDEPKSSMHPDPEKNIHEETVHENKLKSDDLQPKAEPQESTEISDEPKSSVHPDPEENIQEESVHENKLKSDDLQPKAEPQESTDISGRNLHIVPTEDAEHQRKSSVWSNLKSFANGILSVWRRS